MTPQLGMYIQSRSAFKTCGHDLRKQKISLRKFWKKLTFLMPILPAKLTTSRNENCKNYVKKA